MNKIGILIALFLSLQVQAQKRILELFSLKDNPSIHEVNDAYKEESAVVIEDYRAVNINYRLNAIEDYQVNTVHRIIHINDDMGVKLNNKISISISKNQEIIRLKVRAISPDGKVNWFDERNLKEVESIGNRKTKKLAVEGLEVGGELEFLYSIKSPIKPYERIYFESLFPVQKLKFELFEKNIAHSAASYNGLPPVRQVNGNLICEDYNVEPIAKETKSSFRSKLKHIDYKVEKYGDKYNVITWESIAKDILDRYQTKSMRINTFLKTLELGGLSEEKQVFKIEDYIKKNIVIESSTEESYENLPLIQKKKIANYQGIVKLYLKCFQQLRIPISLVFPTSRYDGKIDEEYSHTLDLDWPILYFPNLDKYVTPDDLALRLGMPEAKYGKSRGLNVKTTNSTALMSLAYDTNEFVSLPMLEAKYNTSQKIFNIALKEDNSLVYVDYVNKSRGYIGCYNRYKNAFKTKKDIEPESIIFGLDVLELETLEFQNSESFHSMNPSKSFVTKAIFKSNTLVENMDDELFVHLGKLLGSQSKVYGEGERAHDVVLAYPKLKESKINLTIPEGYHCTNLDKLKKHVYFTHDKNAIYFDANYTLNDQQLQIVIKEGYNTILIKKEHYKDYKEVINSVADINAFVLVLEKL